MAFHVFSPQNVVNTKEVNAHPYATNTRNVCTSLKNGNHTVFHYGAEGSQVDCTEHIDVVSQRDLDDLYGETHKNFGALQLGNTGDRVYELFAVNAFHEVAKRLQDGDYILAIWNGHRPLVERIMNVYGEDLNLVCCEPAVGYEECWTRYRVFPSKAFQAFTYGRFHQNNNMKPEDERWDPNAWTTTCNPYSFVKFGDAVIPHSVDTSLFTLQEEKGDYLCYVGRIIYNKGVKTAAELAKELGVKLKIAGAGNYKEEFGEDLPSHVEHVGMVDLEQRDELMGGAIAGICMARYIEPFGYTGAEFGACGTPVICYELGGTAEIVLDKLTGYHVSDFQEALDALKNINKINPAKCRRHIEKTYNIKEISRQYNKYFKRLDAYHKACLENKGETYLY